MASKASDFVSADRVSKILDIDLQTLEKLRTEESLPFIKINRFNQIYHLPSVFKWLLDRETQLGSETKNEQGLK